MHRRTWNAVCIAVLLALTTPQVAVTADDAACAVAELDGPSARIWIAGDWTDLAPGAAIPRDAKVVTDAATRVRIVCADGLEVTIGTATEVNLESLSETGGGRVVQIIEGFLGIFGGGDSGLRVRTPLLIASVRSTRWTVEQSAADGAAVFVREGRVRVLGRDRREVFLGGGLGVTVSPDGMTGGVKKWGAARIAATMGALGFDWE